MSHSTAQAHLTQQGVAFMVNVEAVGHQCIVTHEAMHKLSALKSVADTEADMLTLFHAYEATISGVARRLVAAGVPANPLVMRPATFCAPHTA
jgi:hypothetical protein